MALTFESPSPMFEFFGSAAPSSPSKKKTGKKKAVFLCTPPQPGPPSAAEMSSTFPGMLSGFDDVETHKSKLFYSNGIFYPLGR